MLRRLEERDAELMLEWMHNPKIVQNYKKKFLKYTKQDVMEFIHRSFSADNKHFAVVNKEDEYIGTISLKNISYYNKNAECAYAFREGVSTDVMTEAVQSIKEYAFEKLHLVEVYARIFEDEGDILQPFVCNGFKKGGTYVGRHKIQGKYRNLCWYSVRKSTELEADILRFQEKGDVRGHLVVVEGLKDVPFEIKRLFYIYGSDESIVRGQHANKKSEFVLINVAGESKVKVDDGVTEKIYELDQPHMGVYLPKMVWKEMYDFSPDSVLLAISNEHYDSEEYIRDYDEFLRLVQSEDK